MTDHLHVIAPFAEGESGTVVRKWSLSHLSFNSSADDLIITPTTDSGFWSGLWMHLTMRSAAVLLDSRRADAGSSW